MMGVKTACAPRWAKSRSLTASSKLSQEPRIPGGPQAGVLLRRVLVHGPRSRVSAVAHP